MTPLLNTAILLAQTSGESNAERLGMIIGIGVVIAAVGGFIIWRKRR